MFVFATLLNVVVITSIVKEKYKLNELWKKIALILALTVLLCAVSILNMIIALFVFGAIALYKIEVIQSLRK